ncbi:hypothetical protein Tco_0723783 [Tanacetum coccineum]
MAMTADENFRFESDTEEPPFGKITFNTNYKIKTSLEEPPTDLELKPLPDNLEYVFLEEPFFLPVIISSHLSEENKTNSYPCMLAIFHDMIEESVEVFMDDFSIFGSSFDHCLNNLNKMLQHCEDVHLVLNWEKCHFMVKEGIMLGHKVSEAGLEVDKAKIDVISKLPPPTNIKAGCQATRFRHHNEAAGVINIKEAASLMPYSQKSWFVIIHGCFGWMRDIWKMVTAAMLAVFDPWIKEGTGLVLCDGPRHVSGSDWWFDKGRSDGGLKLFAMDVYST